MNDHDTEAGPRGQQQSRPTDRPPRIALVTGAASGVGRAVVAHYAENGWHVLGVDLNEHQLSEVAGDHPGYVTPLCADVADLAQMTAVVEKSGVHHLDACVNVAGIYPPSTLMTFTPEIYRSVFDVNVLGLIVSTRVAVPLLKVARKGAVLNIASIGAYYGDGHNLLYKASKAAVVSITRSMAVELAPDDIIVNGIAPGPVETEGSIRGGGLGNFDDRELMGRAAQPSEIAQWVWALAGANPLPFTTGETVIVSGGSFMR